MVLYGFLKLLLLYKKENNYIGTLHIAYGVIGQSLLTKLMPLCPANAVHKYHKIILSLFYISSIRDNL